MALPTLTGVARLAADPDLKFTQSGKAVCSVRMAFNSRRLNQQTKEWEDGNTFWVRGTAWEQLAENIAETLSKGMEVMVSGEIHTDSWEKDGQKHERPELAIRSIGPSLAYATARVERASRDSNGRSGGSGQQQAQRGRQAPADDPWSTSGSSGAGNSYQGDEPPF